MAVPAFATHTSTVDLQPEWSSANTNIEYTVTFTNNGPDAVGEIRIYKNENYVDFVCNPKTGWVLSEPAPGICNYYAYPQADNKIMPGNSEFFIFSAKTPPSGPDYCNLTWQFETRDITFPNPGSIWYLNATTSVDDKAPEITKEVIGPQDLDNTGELCPNGPGAGEECWITQGTQIVVSVVDQGDCGVSDLDYCTYSYTVDGVPHFEHTFNPEEPSEGISWEIYFDEDSVHELTIICEDVAGNQVTDIEVFRVDDTDPETTKTYGFPHFPDPIVENEYPHWITTQTPITLTSEDPDPTGEDCNIGVDETFYRNIYEGPGELDQFCASYETCQTWQPCVPDKGCDGPDCGCEDWVPYTEPFYKTEESCHIIEYFSVDELGNTEPINWQCVYVDTTPPLIWKTHSAGMIPDNDPILGDFNWMTQDMNIDLYCNDTGAHPVDNVNLWYRTWDDISGEWSEWIDSIAVESHKRINFTEDSVHKIQYYCEDALGNSNGTAADPYEQTYRVDSTPPQISKDMFGSFLGDCPSGTDLDHGDCFVADNGTSGVDVSVIDPDPTGMGCNSNEVYCTYGVWWFTTEQECYDQGYYLYDSGRCSVDSGDFLDYKQIIFTEDSTHELYVNCWDALGNKVLDVEIFLVDSTPPVTTKTYVGPQYPDPIVEGQTPYPHWISSHTTVNLAAVDEKVGVDKTYYRVTQVEDMYCESYASGDCINAEGVGDFVMYADPFTMNESCHFIEFYSTDLLGNIEQTKSQCVFVDNSPPDGSKVIGDPHVVKEDEDFVSQETPFTLSCEDVLPHPVGQETLCYKVSLEDDGTQDITDQYCDPNDDGYCCTQRIPFEFYFNEDTYHNLEYYCEDALGNSNTVDLEYFTVDTLPPIITKTVEGPQIGDCPPTEEGDICFIDGVTGIHVDAVDQEPHPVEMVTCDWSYEVVGTDITGGELGVVVPFVINFPEESEHQLTITCWDGLNNETTDIETFFVDKTPPAIWKRYSGPFEEFEFEDYWAEWISSASTVHAGATDDGPHKSGIAEVKYRTTLVDNEYCMQYYEEDEFECEDAEGTGDWTFVDSEDFDEFEFSIPEDSCHLIEITATDNVDKVNEHKQCVFVDNQGPDPLKTVGEPKTEWYPVDFTTDPYNPDATHFYPEIVDLCWNGEEDQIECWKVTTLTPIYMECNDPDPHPVNHNSIYFIVELDGDEIYQSGQYAGQYVTEVYCNINGGDFNVNGDGYCFVEDGAENFVFIEETEHNLKYYCEDALGNKGPVDDEKFKVNGTSFTIQLNHKWNLISVPFVLINDSPEEVFDEIQESIESIWTYDAEADEWYVYHPNGVLGTDNLEHIEPGWGYWVMADNAADLVIGGSQFIAGQMPSSRNLKTGWNLIGYYGADGVEVYDGPDGEGREAGDALFSLGSSYLDKGWTSLLSYWEPFNPYQWHTHSTYPDLPGLGYYDNMDPGAGYWILLPEDGIYAYASRDGPF